MRHIGWLVLYILCFIIGQQLGHYLSANPPSDSGEGMIIINGTVY